MFLLLPFLLLTFFFFSPSKAFADEKFETNYDVTYSVLENGTTSVTQNITLKNKTDEFRASEYGLELGLTDVENLQISDTQGPITAKIEKTEEKTKVQFTFNQVVIGKDKILPFKISFQTRELAKKRGLIWEVNIPGIEDKKDINDYNLTLFVPESFEKPVFVKSTRSSGDEKQLSWTKDEIPKGGIIVAFGEFQVYNFNLKYHLKNPRLYPVQTEIALPPQTNYQRILINTINPKPLNVKIDKDGNWLASFRLTPSSVLNIEVTGVAQIFFTPEPQNDNSKKLTVDDQKNYLLPQKYWEVDDKDIKEIAKFLKTPVNIYDFVVGELTYDYKRVETGLGRIGASSILKNKKSAVCMEFTDLFITLARAAGIPAREVNGFAYTQNPTFRPLSLVKDTLHAWPEYYDSQKETWIMVDPTWGNTTGGLDYFNVLDFNHLTFVIKGQDSEYPVPAGDYKIDDKEAKDIEVTFGTRDDLTTSQNVKIQLKNNVLTIQNTGNSLIPSHTINITTQRLTPLSQNILVPELAPFGKQDIFLKFDYPSILNLISNNKVNIKIISPYVSQDFEISVAPVIILLDLLDRISGSRVLLIGGGLIGAVILVFLARKTWRLYFQKRSRKNPLRR